MNRNLKAMMQELNKSKDLDSNLGLFAKEVIRTYYDNAFISLSLNYYTFYEMHYEDDIKELEQIKGLSNQLNTIISSVLSEGSEITDLEKNIAEIESLRNEMTKRMEVLTAFTDILQNYEYIINRLELKFADNVATLDEASAIQDILQYIFSTKDNMTVNSRIKEVIGQLPVRMTKAKYFDLISDSLSVYNGAEKATIDNYLYMLRGNAMLYKPEGMEDYFVELSSFIGQLKQTSFKELSKEEFDTLANRLDEVAGFALAVSDIYMILQQLINNIYIIAIAKPYVMNSQVEELGKTITDIVSQNFSKEVLEELPVEIEEKLMQTEGIQEELSYDISVLEGTLFDISNQHTTLIESLMLDKIYHVISICQKLSSSSYFISLKEETENSSIADEQYISKVKNELLREMDELFAQSNVFERRAVIANTIDKFPVFFTSTDDVKEYIENSLSMCNDQAEKIASIELIRQGMEEQQAL